jgi:hypothetical protein
MLDDERDVVALVEGGDDDRGLQITGEKTWVISSVAKRL